MTNDDTAPAHIFFKRLRPLDAVAHKDVRIDRDAGYGFARQLIAAPLVMADFAPAARDYPIVFVGEPAQAFALLGLRRQRNLLIGEDGQWRKGRYVPSHLRSYPFGYAEAPEQRILLCIDEAAEHLAPNEQRQAAALFIDGQPSPLVHEMLDFLTQLHGQHGATQAFSAAVAAAQLLIERKAEVTLANGEQLSLDGFHIIDEQRFNALPEATFLDWRNRGWLAPIYFHLQSFANLVNLVVWANEETSA